MSLHAYVFVNSATAVTMPAAEGLRRRNTISLPLGCVLPVRPPLPLNRGLVPERTLRRSALNGIVTTGEVTSPTDRSISPLDNHAPIAIANGGLSMITKRTAPSSGGRPAGKAAAWNMDPAVAPSRSWVYRCSRIPATGSRWSVGWNKRISFLCSISVDNVLC